MGSRRDEGVHENFGEELAEKFVGELAVLNETAKKSCNLSFSVHYNSRPSAIFRANGSDGRRV